MIDMTEIDAETGEVIERDFTPDELAQREAAAQVAAAAAAAEAERLALVDSARLKIAETSGLTPEEMTALGL